MFTGLLKSLPQPPENKKDWPWLGETSPAGYEYRKDWPKISIVTPSYNQGMFLEETLRSVLLQNYPNLELIVIDGGSKDDSVEIIKKYEPWITYWISEKDKGQSDALNKGFNKITGEIVTWLNSDDLFTKDTLKRIAEIFSELSDEYGLVYGGVRTFRGNETLGEDYGYDNPTIERFIAGQAFSQPSAFFKSKSFKEAGPWVRQDLHLGMDYDIFARLACVSKFHSVKEIFSLYRLHESSKTVTQHSHLVDDWTRTFANLCSNFGWNDVIEKLNELSFLKEFTNYRYDLPFREKKEYTGNVDRNLTVFYHLCYWLKSFYWYNRHDEARQLLRYMKKNYPVDMLKKEKAIAPIMFKLAIPPFALKALKKIKNMA